MTASSWLLAAALWAPAADPTPGDGAELRPPVVAVVDPTGSDRTALLEAELLSDAGLTLVDRRAIQQVLGEQKLQAAFGPQGVGDRVRLGKVLKADVIVLVRPQTGAGAPAVEVVVCETAGGLRLIARPVPLTKDATADGLALAAAVRVGFRKYGEQIREVVAVPPFVGHDLGYEFDHLKAAYARLAELAAADRPGVVAVELAEAEAIATELKLAAPGERVGRSLPVYLLGEYRNDGTGAARRVELTLRAERGGKLVGDAKTLVVAPAEAAAAVQEWATNTVSGAGSGETAPPDPKSEAKRLAELAERFRRTGEVTEALELMEASLLLDPRQPNLHAHAVRILAEQVDQTWRKVRHDPSLMPAVVRLVHRRRSHLGQFLDTATFKGWPNEVHQLVVIGQSRLLNGPLGVKYAYLTPEVVEQAKHVDAERAPLGKRIAELASRHGYWISPVPYWEYPRDKRYAAMEQLLRDYQARYQGEDKAGNFFSLTERGTAHPDDPPGEFTPDYLAFLDRVDTFAGPGLKKVVARQRQTVLDEQAGYRWGVSPRAFGPPKPVAAVPGEQRLRLVPIPVVVADGGKGTPASGLLGVQAAGPGADLYWGWGGILYLMTEKGSIRPLWQPSGYDPNSRIRSEHVASTCFDGKFVWVVVTSARTEQVNGHAVERQRVILLAVDPTTGTVNEVTADDGLPGPRAGADAGVWGQPRVLVAPLGPGRIAAVGYFSNRSWAATIDRTRLAGGGRAVRVDVIYEARKLSGPRTKNWKPGPDEVFYPNRLAVLRHPETGVAKLLVIRSSFHPLIIDVATGRPESTGYTIWSFGSRTEAGPHSDAAVDADRLYVSRIVDSRPYRRIDRIAYPGTTTEILVPWPSQPSDGDPNLSQIVPYEGRMYVAENRQRVVKPAPTTGPEVYRRPTYGRCQRWWVLEPGAKALRLAAAETPGVDMVGESSHYGLIAVLSGAPGSTGGTLAVVDFGPATPPREP